MLLRRSWQHVLVALASASWFSLLGCAPPFTSPTVTPPGAEFDCSVTQYDDPDGDRVYDPDDVCPHDREIYNLADDHDGCPDTVATIVYEEVIERLRVNFSPCSADLDRGNLYVLRAILTAALNLADDQPQRVSLSVIGCALAVEPDPEHLALQRARVVRDAARRIVDQLAHVSQVQLRFEVGLCDMERSPSVAFALVDER